MRFASALLPMLLVLGSCRAPPKPPTVDESSRRPANSATAMELQVCKSELQNTRIGAAESGRIAATAAVHLKRASMCQQALAASAMTEPGNILFTIRFDFGSTRVIVPADAEFALTDRARAAALVLLRGRTDGVSASATESRIARDRAAAVRAYLVGSGVDPARIRTTYQPSGDHAADNASAAGRALNRRVEIELYRELPVAMAATSVVGR
jgi:outer membrane protein OmpA-like peptidoglycan-associated protein